MSKHDILSAEEAASYTPHSEILRYIADKTEKESDRFKNLKILDWGCGRGRLVAYLLDRGADAYGVDIDPNTIRNAQQFYHQHGYNASDHLRTLDDQSKTDFPDDYFDVIVSDNVLEHVADLDSVFAEMARLTKPGGRCFHLFPARFTLFEGHLCMPLVHWLPKNNLRRRMIQLFTASGVEPHWRELDQMDRSKKAETYFRYSCDKTFYRAPRDILETCSRYGFAGRLVAGDHPRMQQVFDKLGLQNPTFRKMTNRLVSDLKTMELYLEKPAAVERAGLS